MLFLEINMKKTWKPKRFIVSFGKTIYIMIILIAQYLLVGVVIACLLEAVVRWTGQDIKGAERVWMIVGWPLMAVVFIYNFFKGMS
jgi:ABC-type sugar transport system permease subunit